MVYYRFIVGLGQMCGYLLLHLHHVPVLHQLFD
jgi:hypothetical protein